jgi:hypothetical protein
MCSLHQTGEFVGRNHGDFLVSFAAHDHNFTVVYDAVEHRSKALSQVGVGGLSHRFTGLIVQDSCTSANQLYNATVGEAANSRLDRVVSQLRLYEHPLLTFSARAKGDGVEVIIRFKDESIPVHTYYFDLHPRDLDDPQFEWSFQRQLYDALHDYFVEMFIRTPQDRKDRQRNGM